jgi:SAM-dependent methyltransferase
MSPPTESWPAYLDRNHAGLLGEVRRTDTLIRLIQELVPAAGRIVEVGCGSAVGSFVLAEAGYSVECVDHDPAVLAWIHHRYQFFSRYLTFHCADMCALPFERQSFALAFSQGLLEHYPDEIIVGALREQARVAGVVVFDVPNARHAHERLRGDERLLENAHYERLCAEAGLAVRRITGRRWISLLRFLPEQVLAARPLLARRFAQNSIFVATAR